MNTRQLRQRLWLWQVVRLGPGNCSPRQFRRFWGIMGGGWTVGGVLGVLAKFRGDRGSDALIAICLLMLVASVVFFRMANSDLRSPRTIEGRITGCRGIFFKGVYGRGNQRYGYRITIDGGGGNEIIFRAPLGRYPYADGDVVRAKVGMRLRWIYAIERLVAPDSEEARALAEKDRELEARIAADPQAALEELKRQRAELEAKMRRL